MDLTISLYISMTRILIIDQPMNKNMLNGIIILTFILCLQIESVAQSYNIRISGGTNSGRSLLSCRPDGFVDLYNTDDYSGRQQWKFVKLSDGFYNILVSGGTNEGEKYLSCRPDGFVDLYNQDDNSGRQKWRLELLPNGNYRIQIASGTNPGKTYLSCTPDGLVDLYSSDDNSGRQQWRIVPLLR